MAKNDHKTVDPNKDLNDFKLLRKQLEPALNWGAKQLLLRVEAELERGSLPRSRKPNGKGLTHAELVEYYSRR